MSACKTLLSLALLSLPIAGYTCNATWEGTTSQNWGDITNWSGMTCYPSVSPDDAVFNNVAQEIVLLVDAASTPINPTVQQLAFEVGSYTINPDSLSIPASSLNLEYTVSTPDFGIFVFTSETIVINAPMTWSAASTPMTINVAVGSTLTFAGTVSDGTGTTTVNVLSAGNTVNTNYSPLVNQSMTLGGSEMLATTSIGALLIGSGVFQITNALPIPSGNGPSVITTNAAGHVYNDSELDIINSGTITGTSGASLNTTSGDFYHEMDSIIFSIQNTGPVTPVTSGFGAGAVLGGNLFIQPGTTMSLSNNAIVTGAGSSGAYCSVGLDVLFNDGGTLTATHEGGDITTGIGCNFLANGNFTADFASMIQFINESTGMIAGGELSGGYGASLSVANTLTLNNSSSLAFMNNAAFTGLGSGCALLASTIVLNDTATLSLENSANISGNFGGVLFYSPSSSVTLTLTGGNFNVTNAVGTLINAGSNGTFTDIAGLTVNGTSGQWTLENDGSVDSSASGNFFYISSGVMNMSGGTLNLINTGAITNGAYGNLLNVGSASSSGGSLTLTGGTIYIQATTGPVDGTSFGSAILVDDNLPDYGSIGSAGGLYINDDNTSSLISL